MLEFNGIQLLPSSPRNYWVIECDATPLAAGAYSQKAFYAESFSQDVKDRNLSIVHREALNLVHAVSA